MSFLSPRLSVSLLCSFSPTHWSVDACGRPPHTPRAGDDDGNGTEKGGTTAAHGQGRQVGQEEEAEVQREAEGRIRSSNG